MTSPAISNTVTTNSSTVTVSHQLMEQLFMFFQHFIQPMLQHICNATPHSDNAIQHTNNQPLQANCNPPANNLTVNDCSDVDEVLSAASAQVQNPNPV